MLRWSRPSNLAFFRDRCKLHVLQHVNCIVYIHYFESVRRIIIACLNRVADSIIWQQISPSDPRPHLDYYSTRDDLDQFPGPSLPGIIDEDQHEEVYVTTIGPVEDARKNETSGTNFTKLAGMVQGNLYIFHVDLSSRLAAQVKFFKIKMIEYARHICIRLPNYLLDQNNFFERSVANPAHCVIVCSNLRSG